MRKKMNRLKEVLQEKGISQSAFAKMLGASRQYVNSICQNNEQPSLATLHDIAAKLGVKAAELVGDGSPIE